MSTFKTGIVKDPIMRKELDDAGSGVTYVGEAPVYTATSAAKWLIERITETGPDLSIKWASADYDQIWDDRASLSYS